MTADTQQLANLILRIVPQIMRILTAEFRRSGHLMTPGNFQLMLVLMWGPASMSELAEYQNVSLPTISRAVSRLEKIGWVRRLANPNDRRITLVELTNDGRLRLEEMSQLAEGILGSLLKTISDDDSKALAAGLEVMRRAFELDDLEKDMSC